MSVHDNDRENEDNYVNIDDNKLIRIGSEKQKQTKTELESHLTINEIYSSF